MEEKEKVKVISTEEGSISINIPDLRLKRRWNKKGAELTIDLDTLKEAMYDPGVEYMFKTGMLYIEDMDKKKKLELEPEDATEPENIIVLSDVQKKRYLTVLPIGEFKDSIKKLSVEQRKELVNFAIENELCDLARSKTLYA
jgi:hypothetical protein